MKTNSVRSVYAYIETWGALISSRLFGRFRWPLWLMLMTGVFLIANHLLARGRAVGIWDVNGAYYPYQVLVADHARAGRFLHWDPWSDGGIPSGGDPQFGAFSPVNVVIGLIAGGTSTGFLIYWLLMWWLGGVGMMLLARHLKAPAWGGAVVAIGFLFCGTYIGHAEHTSLITAYSLLPFVIWRVDVALCSRRALPAIEAGAIWGLSALAGYPAIIIITGCFAGLWALGRWLCADSAGSEPSSDDRRLELEKTPRPTLGFVVSALALMLIVGVVILAPTYFAYFHEGAGTHNRTGALDREYVVSNDALPPDAISTLSSPYLLLIKFFSRTKTDKGLWPDIDISMCGLYSGAIITTLALLAFFGKPQNKWRWWVLGIGLLNLAFALGQSLPLRGWLYDWLYPTRFFRHSAIFRAYFIFAIAVLAIVATRDLAAAIRQPANRAWRHFFAASILAAICALLVFLHYFTSPAIARLSREGDLIACAHAFAVWLGICVVAIAGWVSAPRVRPWLLPALLLALAATDAFMTARISRGIIADRDPRAVKRWKTLDERHSDALDLTRLGLLREEISFYQDGDYRLGITNDQMITKIPAFNSYATAINNYHMVIARHPKMKQMAVGTERFWFSKEAGRAAPIERNFTAFSNRVEALNGFPLVVHSPEGMLRPWETEMPIPKTDQAAEIERLPAAEKISVKLLKYSPDELTFEAQCAAGGWLLVTDRWARNWRAEVNGKPVTVYGGNFIFRAVQVSAGQNKVSFTYRPAGFPWLLILSWGTLAVVGLCSIIRYNVRPNPMTKANFLSGASRVSGGGLV